MTDEAGAQNPRVAPPTLEPLPLTGISTATIGTGVWIVALVATTLGQDWLAARGHNDWPWICAGGAFLGLLARFWAIRRAKILGLPH